MVTTKSIVKKIKNNFKKIVLFSFSKRLFFFNSFFSFPAPGVAARSRVAEMLAQPGDHGIDHAGVHRCGGPVVHVNREMRRHVRVT